ncbi:hypothetical protein JIG36_23440 [Actinoplanes sp. LDG1-06]|uniref:Ig-like domain-containing protein n=2 Tax=Paractinoplanes ovalisporus TaxID=2810368 RepID=A0ABS2AFG2_9ACTN|nr:hypothetical protein [Actinoplanes ovalisporus]
MPPPADPWATINRPAPTVFQGGPDGAFFADPDRTAVMGSPGAAPAVGSPPGAGRVAGSSPGAGPVAGDPGRTAFMGDPGKTARLTPAGPSSAPAAQEVRFGPGVPPTPVPAPAWPAVVAPARRRPLWRRLVSVLSALVTLALVVVVGLYLWQRLSPIEVESATVAVARPAGSRCGVTTDVVATVRTNGKSGVIRYQWLRSDAGPGAMLSEQVGRGQRTATLTLKWTFSGVGTTTETATVNILEPSPLQATTQVAYNCRG